MRRRPVLVLAPLVLAGLAVSAHAAPPGTTRAARAAFVLDLGKGATLSVDLSVTTGHLHVQTQQCDADGCGETYDWAGSVRQAAVDDPQASATLDTVIAGTPLSVAWAPTGQTGVALQSLDASGGPNGDTAATYEGDPATARVRLGEQTCSAAASVGQEVRVSDSANDAADPLAELKLPEGTLGC